MNENNKNEEDVWTMVDNTGIENKVCCEKPIDHFVNDDVVKTEKWCDFDLQDDLLRGIYNYGFEDPSEIQKKAILPIISGKDIIAQAQSGSGKTATFLIGSLHNNNVYTFYYWIL